MLKQFSSFCGYDLKTGCRIIAVVSAVASVLLATFFFCIMVNGLHNVQNPEFRNYGSVHSFITVTGILGVKQIVHLLFCFMLFTGSKSDNVYGIRSWLKSNVIGLCVIAVLGSYCTVLLFASGSTALGVVGVFMLLLSVPSKIYFGLVVNSYHNLLTPDHIWGSGMHVEDSVYPRTCRTVPPILVSQPTAVNVAV